jgi:hypothetical protein
VAQTNNLLAQTNKRSVVACGYEMAGLLLAECAERVKALVSWTVLWAAVAALAILIFRTFAALFALIWSERMKALVLWTVLWAAVAALAILTFHTFAALFALIWS